MIVSKIYTLAFYKVSSDWPSVNTRLSTLAVDLTNLQKGFILKTVWHKIGQDAKWIKEAGGTMDPTLSTKNKKTNR